MITLRSYEFLEDAWQGGAGDWCRSASRHVLGGGQAWMVTVSDGQANWVKRRLLKEGISLFGLQFFNISTLRTELCQRHGMAPASLGKETLIFTLRLRALELSAMQPDAAPVARHPGACLNALADFAAADWIDDDPNLQRAILPPGLDSWLADLRRGHEWPPEIDRRLREFSLKKTPLRPTLALCVFGWDASFWPSFNLLAAAVDEARSALVFAPLPRGSSFDVQMEWQTALEEFSEAEFDPCDSVDFSSAHTAMISRLEGTDLHVDKADSSGPELLVGLDMEDTVILARDFVSRWLAQNSAPDQAGSSCNDDRLVILSPRRDLTAVALLRSLAAAGISVGDELGEIPEPSLAVQIQRAILAYHQDKGDLEGLLAIVELLNEHVAIWDGQGDSVLRQIFPLDAVEARRLLHTAFGMVQHHSARVLREAFVRSRSDVALPLGQLVEHLEEWPEHVSWEDALHRWQRCLMGLGLSTDLLEPLWSQLQKLPLREQVPTAAFFHFLAGVLGCAPARRSPDGMHRYARVVMTTLDGAMGQSWGAALFLDSNEGAWPLYPGENSFLDDDARRGLNQQREAGMDTSGALWRGYLLTSADQAQLEHFRFMEILGNCQGPIAFAGQARDAVEPGQELYANEWALRCLLETGKPAVEGEKLLDRWHEAIRRTTAASPALPKAERDHLRTVFKARRDPTAAFDEYSFNFESLTGADELPWTDAWSVRDLETAWNQPATFALRQIFGVTPTRMEGREWMRGEGWMVGRLVHRWLLTALGASDEPRLMTDGEWKRARTDGLSAVRRETERTLTAALARQATTPPGEIHALPLWWQSALQRAEWAADRCLEGLEAVGSEGSWLSLNRKFDADIVTGSGLLRLRARCDVLLSNQPSLDNAVCQLIDIRTGAASGPGLLSAAQLDKGQGLEVAALMFLALREGAQMEKSRIGVLNPAAANLSPLTVEMRDAAAPAMERLAKQQRTRKFGQRSNPGSTDRARGGETLPLATAPIDLNVFASKLAL